MFGSGGGRRGRAWRGATLTCSRARTHKSLQPEPEGYGHDPRPIIGRASPDEVTMLAIIMHATSRSNWRVMNRVAQGLKPGSGGICGKQDVLPNAILPVLALATLSPAPQTEHLCLAVGRRILCDNLVVCVEGVRIVWRQRSRTATAAVHHQEITVETKNTTSHGPHQSPQRCSLAHCGAARGTLPRQWRVHTVD